tara:strand:- start:20 stop:175 length:156 start_codon:yes stop_codon:yes gene_type:complete
MYKLFVPLGRTEPNCVIRLSDNSYIPMDKTNTDYQEYLEWVAQGNTPEEAD